MSALPKNSLPSNQSGYFADHWLLDVGLVSSVTIDNLLAYAYMQYSVENVTLEIFKDDEHQGAAPVITYKIQLKKPWNKRYKALRNHAKSGGLWAKWRIIRLMKSGTPAVGQIEEEITKTAKSYLPPKYAVKVEIE